MFRKTDNRMWSRIHGNQSSYLATGTLGATCRKGPRFSCSSPYVTPAMIATSYWDPMRNDSQLEVHQICDYFGVNEMASKWNVWAVGMIGKSKWEWQRIPFYLLLLLCPYEWKHFRAECEISNGREGKWTYLMLADVGMRDKRRLTRKISTVGHCFTMAAWDQCELLHFPAGYWFF